MMLREDCDKVEKLGEEVKILVAATSVEAMRADELKRYKDTQLLKDIDIVSEVCREVSIEQDPDKCRAKMKIPDLFYKEGVKQASPRLENLVYVLFGHDMPAIEPLTDLTSLRNYWYCIIETGFNADDIYKPHPRQQTKDLSLKELPQFSKSLDM